MLTFLNIRGIAHSLPVSVKRDVFTKVHISNKDYVFIGHMNFSQEREETGSNSKDLGPGM